jgi:TonB family protein
MKIVHPIHVIILLAGLASLPTVETNNRANVIESSARDGGFISGTVFFDGSIAKPVQLDMSGDAICVSLNPKAFAQDDAVVTNGKLANVLVYVTGPAIEGHTFDAPSSPVVLAHKNCQLEPHVLGIQVGQKLLVNNADPTTHNTKLLTPQKESWNISSAPGSSSIERRFTTSELYPIFIRVTDNQHPWEKAYLAVMAHPFFSVSTLNGDYQIAGLPVGRYTVVAWHERFGEKRAEIEVGSTESKTVDFTFGANEPPASNPSRGSARNLTIEGGVLNGKAVSKPDPVYPPAAKARGITGNVIVEVVVDEAGKVIHARAESGLQQLRPAAVKAAYQATFAPTLLSGKPVKVRGVIIYNFRLP